MAFGPVDLYIVAFPGNKFTGEIAPAIMKKVDDGTIRVLDVLFVSKDADGTVTTLAMEDVEQGSVGSLAVSVTAPGALNEEDADEVADDIPAGSSALLIAYENTWMQDLVGAFMRAGAVPIDQIRIPAYVVNEVVAE